MVSSEDAMNTTRALQMPEWQTYFDQISKALAGERAFVEIEGLTFGDRTQANCLPLIGITYDSKDDVLEIAMEGLDHLTTALARLSSARGPKVWNGWALLITTGKSRT